MFRLNKPIKARHIHFCITCRAEIPKGGIYYKSPFVTCENCISQVEKEQEYRKKRLNEINPNGAWETSKALALIDKEIREGIEI